MVRGPKYEGATAFAVVAEEKIIIRLRKTLAARVAARATGSACFAGLIHNVGEYADTLDEIFATTGLNTGARETSFKPNIEGQLIANCIGVVICSF